jgi:dTDP-4-dehydrorhamnose 3,5-epimerase
VEVEELELAGLKLIRPKVFSDPRGFFIETFSARRYAELGIDCQFVQDNHARSVKNTLRGLHYQSAPGQAKLIRCVSGRILDVVVDIRPGSTTFGRWKGVELDAVTHAQLFVPIGFAHGYCVLSDYAEVEYKVSSYYDAQAETGIRWNDPDVNVEWPVREPILSPRDQVAETFADYRKRVRA